MARCMKAQGRKATSIPEGHSVESLNLLEKTETVKTDRALSAHAGFPPSCHSRGGKLRRRSGPPLRPTAPLTPDASHE